MGSQQLASVSSLVKLYAMVNVVVADSAISSWKEKYESNLWQAVAGIRSSDDDTTYFATEGDPARTRLGAPMTNTRIVHCPCAFF
jgi:hypothetical protein